MKTIYAIPNYECNLKCKHCQLHEKHIDYDSEKFISALLTFSNDNVILFGGEPMLHKDRFVEIINTGKVRSVSSNLTLLDDKLIQTLELHNISMSTSWNYNRFYDALYSIWLNNIVHYYDITHRKLSVLITMTKDLIEDAECLRIHDILSELDSTNAIDSVLFEHYVGDYATKQFNELCDAWLCKMHQTWKYKMHNKIEEKVLNWSFVCKDIFTLLPNGLLVNHCPLYFSLKLLLLCIHCKLNVKCKPCRLQFACSFPKKLYYLISK